jgi:hypothetical protein
VRVLVLPDGVGRVRWSCFGVGGVGDSVELDVGRLVLACEWLESFAGRAASEGAGSVEVAEEWGRLGDFLRGLGGG